MSALLSPLQLQAAASLLQNQGIRVNQDLETQIALYQANPAIANIRSTISSGASVLANTTIATLQTLAADSCPALADSIPQAYVNPYPPSTSVITTFSSTGPTTGNSGLSGMLTLITNSYLGNGDVSKFAQVFSAAHGYCVTTNVFINSAVNAENYLSDTFSGMDNLITSDLTQVNLDTQNFGNDLAKLGEAINLANLDNYGTPLALLQQIIKKSGISTPIIIALVNQGINENTILELGNPELVVTDAVQKQMYTAMTTIAGDSLDQILAILGVTTPGIATLADLLDPSKIFPNSYTTLTAPSCDGGCTPVSDIVLDIGQVMFQTRQPPEGQDPVYPISNESWSPFMNTNAVWEFSGSVFQTRQQSDVTAQSWPAWSSFMNTNAVWNSDIYSGNFEKTYSVTFPTSGNYTFISQCDNYATVSLDGDQILYVDYFTGDPLVTTVYVNAGTYTLSINAVNTGGPGGFALNIATASAPADFLRTYSIDIPVTGVYTLSAQSTGEGDIIIDGDSTATLTLSGTAPAPEVVDITLSQGTHEITIDINSSASLSGVGVTLTSAFSTRPDPRCGLLGIYLPAVTGSQGPAVNAKLTTQLPEPDLGINYLRLSRIIPDGLALADRALAVSLQQISNISKITLPQLARAYQNIETNKDLPAINSQFQPVTQDAVDYFKNGLAKGTGENGTILITDVIGSATGTVVLPAMSNVVTAMSNLSGSLSTLTTIYNIMLGIVTGVYGDPTLGPITGLPSPYNSGEPYADADSALTTVMIPAAQAEIVSIQSADLANTAMLNEAFTAIGGQLSMEYNFQKLATLDVNQLSGNSQTSTQTLVFALPSYGKDTEAGGTAQYLEDIADLTHPGGQALVATLREGRNRTVLNDSGLLGSTNVSADPPTPPTQATLISSEYTKSEAQARIIT